MEERLDFRPFQTEAIPYSITKTEQIRRWTNIYNILEMLNPLLTCFRILNWLFESEDGYIVFQLLAGTFWSTQMNEDRHFIRLQWGICWLCSCRRVIRSSACVDHRPYFSEKTSGRGTRSAKTLTTFPSCTSHSCTTRTQVLTWSSVSTTWGDLEDFGVVSGLFEDAESISNLIKPEDGHISTPIG